jgi:hypothetical protein
MTSFYSEFTTSEAYISTGISGSASFIAFWPPEMGCIGYSVDENTVEARITDIGRKYIARSVVDGTSFIINEFAVGIGGYDPSYPTKATIVDPTSTDLIAEIYRAALTTTEEVLINGTSKSYVARIGSTVAGGVGEVGIFAEILNSPYPSEVGSSFLFCLAHQPLNTKTRNHVATYRIVVAF